VKNIEDHDTREWVKVLLSDLHGVAEGRKP
jgi:hypothetical protein